MKSLSFIIKKSDSTETPSKYCVKGFGGSYLITLHSIDELKLLLEEVGKIEIDFNNGLIVVL